MGREEGHPENSFDSSRPLQRNAHGAQPYARYQPATESSSDSSQANGEAADNWQKLINSNSYPEALCCFSASSLDKCCKAADASAIIDFAAYCLDSQELPTCLTTLRRILCLGLASSELRIAANALLLIALASIGTEKEYRVQLVAFRESSATWNRLSTETQNLVSHALSQSAWRALATGSTLLAMSLVGQLENTCRQVGTTTPPQIHSMLRGVVKASLARRIFPTHLLRRLGSKSIRTRLYANAIDAVRVYGKGNIVVISGWHASRDQEPIELFLLDGSNVHRVNPRLILRSSRQDLCHIERRYGIQETGRSGFDGTIMLTESQCSRLRSSASCMILISDISGNTSLHKAAISHRRLESNVVRHSISMLVSSQLTLVDYPSAVILRDAWSTHLEQASAKAGSHSSFGHTSQQPQLSIVVPLYGRIDFMEFQLNWFNTYLQVRGNQATTMQLIYILDDPTLHEEAIGLAKRCSHLYRMPFELVTTESNLGFAGANNLASQFAKAENLLLMNSDVLPAGLDSIELMLSEFHALDKRVGALGARLLYPSGDLQHLGMEFMHDSSLPGILGSSWLNNHPNKFICHSSGDLPQAGIIGVEAATAACMLLSRSLFKVLEGFKLCYITGDFEDSDMCLRIRERGLEIAVHVGATFYHLERQSMGLHANQEEQRLKVVAFNAMTHHERHSAAITRLKQESGNSSVDRL